MPLRMSSPQFKKIEDARDREFVDGMAEYLVRRFRLDVSPDFQFADLVSEVAPIVTQAGQLGLPRYDGYALHVLASFILGVDYHATSAVRPVLYSKELSGDLKALWLDRWFSSLEDLANEQAKA